MGNSSEGSNAKRTKKSKREKQKKKAKTKKSKREKVLEKDPSATEQKPDESGPSGGSNAVSGALLESRGQLSGVTVHGKRSID